MQKTLDLKTNNPRPPKDSWAGMVWVPRMADKARAAKADCLGDFMFPCPMDKIILGFLDLGANAFSDLATKNSDDELSLWFQKHLKDMSADELQKANHALLKKQPDTPEKWAKFDKIRNELAPDRKDIDTWAALIEIEEGHA